jgi:hypothetical protein
MASSVAGLPRRTDGVARPVCGRRPALLSLFRTIDHEKEAAGAAAVMGATVA